MAAEPFDAESYVTASAALIGLEIHTDHRPGVVLNVERIAQMAALVMEFPLPDDIEAAPIYRP